MAERWTLDSWRKKPILQVPDYPDAQALADVEKQLATFPPLVFAGEARALKAALARVAARRGFPAAGRRLRRELRRARRQQYPRLLPRVPADGGGADVRGGVAGGEGRPHRRTVRQAALLADRKARRRRTAELSRRHHQRHRLHAGGAHSRSAPADRGLSAVGGDAQPAARVRARRLRQSEKRAQLDAGLREGFAAVAPLHRTGRPHFAGARLHAGLRSRSRKPSRTARDRFLHQPRSAAARLRAGVDARGFDPARQLVLHVRPHGLDRRPHAPARPRAYRILPRHQESARAQVRTVAEARRSAAADRHSQSGQRRRAG